MNIVIKYFHELTTQELYNILQLRSEVFVVEQNCIYQDIDGKDQKAVHIFIKKIKMFLLILEYLMKENILKILVLVGLW